VIGDTRTRIGCKNSGIGIAGSGASGQSVWDNELRERRSICHSFAYLIGKHFFPR
jgi:hypothetical protein